VPLSSLSTKHLAQVRHSGIARCNVIDTQNEIEGGSEVTQEIAEGASMQSAAIGPSANASLLVETVPEQQQEASIDVDAPHVSESATVPAGAFVPANASAATPRVCAQHKQRRAKRAASGRRLRRKTAKRGDSGLVE
jgi:hypothetical protein